MTAQPEARRNQQTLKGHRVCWDSFLKFEAFTLENQTHDEAGNGSTQQKYKRSSPIVSGHQFMIKRDRHSRSAAMVTI